MTSKKKFLIIFPLFLGIAIYFLYRSKNLLYFNIFKTHQIIYDITLIIRKYAWYFRKNFPLWFVYSLPDGLWLFSFGISLLVERVYYLIHFLIFTAIYVFMIFFEYIQKYYGGHGSMIGTYDKNDIIFFSLGYVFVILISLFCRKKEAKSIAIKRKENFENILIIFVFSILGILPSLI